MEQNDETYGNKFMEAFNVLKEKTENNDKIHEYIFNNDNVEFEGENIKNFNIVINGKINKVEIKKINHGWFTPTTYEIQELNNEQSTKQTKTTKHQQSNNIG